MVISRYEDFILESMIRASKEFLKIVDIIKGESSVASKLAELLGQDVKTNYNFIKIADDPAKLNFVPDSQATRRLAAGTSDAELFAAASNPTTIGRLVKSIFNSNKIPVTDDELERFGNLFRSYASLLSNTESITIVTGDQIKKWYHEKNYAGREGRDGTLNKSCMRHDDCQEFFDIYTLNPDIVSMVIKVNDEGRLEARALLWQTDKGPYLDRVYSLKPDVEKTLELWAEMKVDGLMKYNTIGGERLHVRIKPHKMYGQFPYMDSFCYYLRDGDPEQEVGATLLNYVKDDAPENLYLLHDTEVGYEKMDTVWSDYHDQELSRRHAVWSSSRESWLHADRSVTDAATGDNIPEDDAVWSGVLDGYIDAENAQEVITDEDDSTDYYPIENSDHPYFEDQATGKMYSEEMRDKVLTEFNGDYYNMSLCVMVSRLNVLGMARAKQIYGQKYQYEFVTELDARLFGMKTVGESVPVPKQNHIESTYSGVIASQLRDLVMKLDAPEGLKEQKILEINEAHAQMMNSDRDYKARNTTADKYGGFDGLVEEWSKNFGCEDVEAVIASTNFGWNIRIGLMGRGLWSGAVAGGTPEEKLLSVVGSPKTEVDAVEAIVDCVKDPRLAADHNHMTEVWGEQRAKAKVIVVKVMTALYAKVGREMGKCMDLFIKEVLHESQLSWYGPL